MPHIVVPIHGTWGRRAFFRRPVAAWCAEDSQCRQSVGRALGDNTTYHPFNWSGDNSTSARLTAAKQLRDYVRVLRHRHPTSKLHVMAHSHAGNIAMYALRDPETASLVSSLICLSTPFLHVSPRQLGANLAKRLELVASVAVFIVTLAAAGALTNGFWPGAVRALIDHDLALLAILPIGGAAPIATRLLLIPMWRRLHENAHRYCEQMTLPRSLPFPVLLVRGAADEASSALGAAQFLGSLLTRLVRTLAATFPLDASESPISRGKQSRRSLPRSVKLGIATMAFAILLVIVIAQLASLDIDVPVPSALLALLVVLLLLLGLAIMVWSDIVAFVVTCAVTVFSSVLAAVLLCFGWRQSLASALSTNVSVETTPPGRWELIQLEHSEDPLEMQRSLNHATHSSLSALTVVEAWLREQFGLFAKCE